MRRFSQGGSLVDGMMLYDIGACYLRGFKLAFHGATWIGRFSLMERMVHATIFIAKEDHIVCNSCDNDTEKSLRILSRIKCEAQVLLGSLVLQYSDLFA